ncbi:MAG: EFR1 family ferrodoxin [Prevotella sp.]|nr:EFR1 family ferrodoxin [Prevotella sp.]MBR1463200.1 EFR1 family ferrodoxin [Prevotella sp.]
MIFYFSGTGNTRWAATEIQQAVNEPMLNMADEIDGACSYTLNEGERIGFCFPVHGWRPPKLVREFIAKLKFSSDASRHFCWALCTAGDDIGQTMEYLNKDLNLRGLHATSVFSLIMPESYVGLPFMDVDSPEKEWTKKTTAARQLSDILPYIVDREPGITRTYKGRWPKTNSHVLGAAFVKYIVSDKLFRVKEDVCRQCGKCAAVCPVHDIQAGKGATPTWKHNGKCLTCFSCYHHCPVHAIEYGSRTKNKGQYLYY